jgi:acid phosphatase (class A)
MNQKNNTSRHFKNSGLFFNKISTVTGFITRGCLRRRERAAKSSNLFLIGFVLLISMGCAHVENQGSPTVTGLRPGFVPGYLPRETVPNSAVLLPPPPAADTTAFTLDQEAYRKTRSLRDTARWRQAAEDADLMFPQAAGTFSCALNAPITEKDTPRLYQLLHRTLTDAALSTYKAKNQYQRVRPFRFYKETSCSPQAEIHLTDGSYPSGHTAIGWAWALILSEIAPDQTNAILARGLAYGENRVICGVHWFSDVMEGRIMGAATAARLHADPVFRADLEAAKAELAAVRAKGLTPNRDCQAEAQALALQPPLTP